jgi:hypothetical protein
MSEEKLICEHCDNEYESLVEVNNVNCCNSCVESFPVCCNCEEKTIETTTVEGNEYCESCLGDLPFCCHCEETVTEVDNDNHCNDCQEHYCDCVYCNSNVHIDTVVYDREGDEVCEYCQQDGTIPEDDDSWYNYDYLYYSERDGLYYAHKQPNDGIQEYHSCIRQKIEGCISGKYVGFELEVVPIDDRDEVAEYLLSKVENIVCENDGSISEDNHEYDQDGFEIISNYGDLDNVLEIASNVVDNIKDKAVSFEAGCCGLHVHVTNKNITYDNAKFVVFWNDVENWEFLKQFTHRDNNSWAKRQTHKNKSLLKSKNDNLSYRYFVTNDDKYELVRVTNNTLEVRGFKGTLHKPRLLACIELAYYTYEYCKLDISIDNLCWKQFMEWLPEDSKYIRPYFETRKDKIKNVEPVVENIVSDYNLYNSDLLGNYNRREYVTTNNVGNYIINQLNIPESIQ